MWDNHDGIGTPPELEAARVGITLRVETTGGAHLIAEYPEVSMVGEPLTVDKAGRRVRTDPFGLRIGVASEVEQYHRVRRPHVSVRGATRDLDLRVRGRLLPADESGAVAWFTDVQGLRAHADKNAAENRALKKEVRALRARVRALGGDQ